MRRRRRRRRRRRFLQEVAHRTRRGCARRRGLVLASASCCSFGRRGHRAWWRGGACWLPLMPFAVFGYFHGGCWRARAQLRQYPPQTCSASIDALSLTPHVSHKKKTRPRATLSRPGPRDSSRYECGLLGRARARGAAGGWTALDLVEETCRNSLSARLRPEKPDCVGFREACACPIGCGNTPRKQPKRSK